MESHFADNKSNTFMEDVKLSFVDLYFNCKNLLTDFFNDFPSYMKRLWEHIKKSPKWQLSGILTLVAFLCFAYTLFTQSFTIPITGDFKLQGMAFIYNGYDDWHYFLRTGTFPLWNTGGAYGVDNVAAYSFYYLFDPFFLILVIFPRAWLNQVQAIMMIVKIVLAGLFFYDYLGAFNLKTNTKKFGAIAYAFCGWTWFYLWFFHMMEAATFLPLMLLGVEKIIRKKDPRLLTVACFLMGAVNYQYLAIFAVFCFIYAMARFFQTIRQRDAKDNLSVLGFGVIGFGIGIAMVAFIILPSFILIQNMPRISSQATFIDQIKNASSIWDKLKLCLLWPGAISPDLWKETSYTNQTFMHLYPLESLLFINNSCFEEPMTKLSGYDNVGSSIYVSTPILLFIIPSIINAIRKKKITQLIGVVLVIVALETPFVYYASGAFSSVAYGRWEIFVSILIITFVCCHIDDIRSIPHWSLDVSLVIVYILFGITVKFCFDWANNGTFPMLQPLDITYNIMGNNVNMYVFGAVFQGIFYLVCYIPLRVTMKKGKHFDKAMLITIGLDAIIMGNTTIIGFGTSSYSGDIFSGRANFDAQTNIVTQLNNYDSKDQNFYRILNTNMTSNYNFDPNISMAEGYNGLATFCSTINYDTADFFNYSKIAHNPNSYMLSYQDKRINLDEFSGVKYYILKRDNYLDSHSYSYNVPFNFQDVETITEYPETLRNTIKQSNFKLFVNNSFIDRMFFYDNYISSSVADSEMYSDEDKIEVAYLKKAVVDSKYLEANSSVFAPFTRDSHLYGESKDLVYRTSLNNSSIRTYFSRAIWDPNPQTGDSNNGVLRTLDSSMTDSAYSDLHQTELLNSVQSDPNSPYGIISDKKTSTGKTLFYLKSASDPELAFETNGDEVTNTSTFSWTSDSHSQGAYYSKVLIKSNTALPKAILAQDASKTNKAYVSLGTTNLGHANIDFYLYGYDQETSKYHLITKDGDNFVHQGNLWKSDIGFYVDEPIYKIVGVITYSFFESFSINNAGIEYQSEYDEDIAKIKQTKVEIDYSKSNRNKVVYKTSQDRDRIGVINYPYSSGFKLVRTYTDASNNIVSENVELFKSQGGFISYIAKGGNNVSYTLTYFTPGLNWGGTISQIALISELILFILYYGLKENQRQVERLKKHTYMKKS